MSEDDPDTFWQAPIEDDRKVTPFGVRGFVVGFRPVTAHEDDPATQDLEVVIHLGVGDENPFVRVLAFDLFPGHDSVHGGYYRTSQPVALRTLMPEAWRVVSQTLRDFAVSDEKFGGGRYLATLSVRFKPR